VIDFSDLETLRALAALALFALLLVVALVIAIVDAVKRRGRDQEMAEVREREVQMAVKRMRREAKRKPAMGGGAEGQPA